MVAAVVAAAKAAAVVVKGGAGGQGGQGTAGRGVFRTRRRKQSSRWTWLRLRLRRSRVFLPALEQDLWHLAGGGQGDLSNAALTPLEAEPISILSQDCRAQGAGVDPGLPPSDRTNMGMRGGADTANGSSLLWQHSVRPYAPPSGPGKLQGPQGPGRQGTSSCNCSNGIAGAHATWRFSKELKPETKPHKSVFQAATGMSANTLGDALRGDPTAMMTAAAVVGAAGSAGAAGSLMARAEAGDPAARAQLESRTGVNADTLVRAARGDESAQVGVMARAGLDDSVREAARNGDVICGDAAKAADMMYARNAATGDYTQISAYDAPSGKFQATDAQWQCPAQQRWHGADCLRSNDWFLPHRRRCRCELRLRKRTVVSLAMLTGATAGGIVYDTTTDKRFEAAGTGAAVNYENRRLCRCRYQRATSSGMVSNNDLRTNLQAAQSCPILVVRANGSASRKTVKASNAWPEEAQDKPIGNGPVMLRLEVRNGEVIASGTNGNVVFDQAQGRFEARKRRCRSAV